jgi:ketosteroid isomerase-like protein
MANNAKEIVLSCINALNNEDFKAARNYASDDMTFVGVLGTRNGAEAYFRDMEHMKLKYDLKKAFVEGDDVCLLYDLNMSGVTLFSCGWYHVKDGKIDSLKVVLDPRPVLEKAGK